MVTRAAGFILTITGLVLAVWFVQMLIAPGDPPLRIFIVAALAVAMLSVGVRYMFKRTKAGSGPDRGQDRGKE